MAQMPHMKRREGDEWYCARCNTRWGVDEEPPEQVCIDARGDDRARRYPPSAKTAIAPHSSRRLV
jgi:hypothetical protein